MLSEKATEMLSKAVAGGSAENILPALSIWQVDPLYLLESAFKNGGREVFMQQDFILVRKMQSGDEAAMDIFVRKYYRQILQYCTYHCPDREWAKDLTQETFERFFRNLAGYYHSGKALNLLYTIARNLCIDWGRKNREAPGGEGETIDMIMADRLDEGCVAEIDDKIIMETAMKNLPDELREVVILHYFQGLSIRELARILQIGLPLAKYRIRKAKEMLRALLGDVE